MQKEKAMSGKINNEIEECIRNNVTWHNLPRHLQQVSAESNSLSNILFTIGNELENNILNIFVH